MHSLPNELYLIEKVLIPMFQNMVKFKVIQTHGPDEHGKDIVLISEGNFGTKQYTAVIVKNEPITNASTKKDKEIVAAVSTQIVMSLTSGYSSIEDNREVSFHDIVVITSHDYSNSARDALVKVASLHNFTSITFWEDKDLINRIDQNLPEIYTTSSGSLSKYFHALRERCERLNELKKIPIYTGDAKRISEVYVEPNLHRKIEQIEHGITSVSYKQSGFSKLVAKASKFVIVGSAGSGKSTLLRSEVNRMIADYESKASKRIPVLVKTYYLLKNAQSEVPEEVLSSYLTSEYGLSREDVAEIFREKNHLQFFFDGFDELSKDKEKELFHKILEYVDVNLSRSIAVSTRKANLLVSMNFRGFEEWKLSDFDLRQITQFFSKWFSERNNHLLQDLKDHDLLEKLPNTPLVMTLIAILFDSDENVEIPSNLSELYKMFIELLLGRWSLDRHIDSFYKANDKETFLTDLALFLHTNNRLSCIPEELKSVFAQTTLRLGRSIDHERMLDELVKDTNLILLNESNEYEFRHLSFQEYLVANHLTLKSKMDTMVESFPHPWWDQVLYFYCGIRKDNEDILPAIFDRIPFLDLRNRLLALLHFGYLIQSSYRTHSRIRKELLQKAVAVFALSVPLLIMEAKGAFKTPEIITYLSIVEVFKMHYGSKFLKEIYESMLPDFKSLDATLFEKALAQFILCSLVSAQGDPNVLVDFDFAFKQHPLLVLMEEFLLRCELLEEAKDLKQRERIKDISRGIASRIRKNPTLYKKMLGLKDEGGTPFRKE
jgi:hypothetical protein